MRTGKLEAVGTKSVTPSPPFPLSLQLPSVVSLLPRSAHGMRTTSCNDFPTNLLRQTSLNCLRIVHAIDFHPWNEIVRRRLFGGQLIESLRPFRIVMTGCDSSEVQGVLYGAFFDAAGRV